MRDRLAAGAARRRGPRRHGRGAARWPTASVDAVTVAQAFHWFDPPRGAGRDRAGCCGPAAHLFLVWNTRDRSHDWVRQFGDLLVDGPDAERPYDSYYDVDYAGRGRRRRAAFTPVELWTHDWQQPCDPDLLVARAESVSVVGVAAAGRQAAGPRPGAQPGRHPPRPGRAARRSRSPTRRRCTAAGAGEPGRTSDRASAGGPEPRTGRRALLAWGDAHLRRPAVAARPATRGPCSCPR